MTALSWTIQASDDLAAIYAFIAQNSEHYALLTVRALIAAPEHLMQFPKAGRIVPELNRSDIREVFWRSYRIVYEYSAAADEIRILTVFRGERLFPLPSIPR